MKPIRDNAAYEEALVRIDELMTAPEGSQEADELEVWAILVEDYEQEQYAIPDAAPIDVLKHVMNANGLSNKDMVRYLGSPSTVSKVLRGDKELTVSQIRILSRELGIPASTLVGSVPGTGDTEEAVDWTSFPLVEMSRRCLFGEDLLHARKATLVARAEELVSRLLGSARLDFSYQPRLRKGIRPGPASDRYAIMAWLLEVGEKAQANIPDAEYAPLTQDDLRVLARLSTKKDGIHQAVACLRERGVPVIFVPHYRHSKIDGGVVVLDGGRPSVGLSLRYDRVDYFWFTLLHEVAHIVLNHVQEFLAEELLDAGEQEEKEQEANELVQRVTVPEEKLRTAIPDLEKATVVDVVNLAQDCDVNVAIVAGRIQYVTGNYRKFARLLGRGNVRSLFKEDS